VLLRQNGARPTIHEYDAKRLLAFYGVPTVAERLVQSPDEAVAAAKALGYPVVMKVVSDDIAHKTDRGLVALALKSESELREAWSRLVSRVVEEVPRATIAGFLVQSFVSGGTEVFVGVKSDPDFGPVLAFGMGGIAIELLQDFALRMLPLREGDAEAMIEEVRGAALLDSVRGGKKADRASLARCIYAIADYAWADRALIGELDLNPIKVMPEGQGCVALDALIVPSIAAGG
jgi:succinyl-CoA synthetase beta subunit